MARNRIRKAGFNISETNLGVVKHMDHYSKYGLASCQKNKNGRGKNNPEKQVLAHGNSERCLYMCLIEAFDLVFGYKTFTQLACFFIFIFILTLHHSRYDAQNTGDVVVVCVEEDVEGELLE